MMLKGLATAALVGAAAAAVIELDPREPTHQATITSNLDSCNFDLILDVRSQYYYDNWRIAGSEWVQTFNPQRLIDENIKNIAVFCWVAPWESEPSAIWIDQHFGPESPYAHLGIQVYDLKGLTYLDDIPDFCKFLDGTPEMVAEMSPHCAGKVNTHTCPSAVTPEVAPAVLPTVPSSHIDLGAQLEQLDRIEMTTAQLAEGIAAAIGDYYNEPVEIDLSGRPHLSGTQHVTLNPTVDKPVREAHDGYSILYLPAEAPKADRIAPAEAPAEDTTLPEEPAFAPLALIAAAIGAAVVLVVAATVAVVTRTPAVEVNAKEGVEEVGAKGVQEVPEFSTENVLAYNGAVDEV